MLTKPFYGRQFFAPSDGGGGAGGGEDDQQPDGKPDGATPEGTKPDEAEKPDADGLTEAGRKAIKTERDARKAAERDLAKYRSDEQQRQNEEAAKQGNFKALYETAQTTITERDTRIAELEGQIAEGERATRRQRIAAKHKLAPDVADRLRGETDEELEADAKALAKHFRVDAPDTEAGQNRNRQPAPNRQAAKVEPAKTVDGTQKVAWPT